jgi:S-layer homology domain.
MRKWTGISSLVAKSGGIKSLTVGLRRDGTVVVHDDYYNSTMANQINKWTNISSVALSDNHAVGLKRDGTVVAAKGNPGDYGYKEYGQCDVSDWNLGKPSASEATPTPKVTPTPTPKATPAPSNTNFGDVPQKAWFAKSVDYCVKNNLVNGTSKTTFSPNNTLTRKDFVTLIGRLAGINPKDTKYSGSAGFTDVKAGQYYAPYVVWAAKTGIVGGTGNNKFSSDSNITREDMATIIVRYMKYADKSLKNDKKAVAGFKDSGKIAGYAKKSVDKMREIGLLKGDQHGNVNPKGMLTRAEGATVIARLHEGLKG